MSQLKPQVYIGIVTYNSAELAPACIEAVLAQTYKPITLVVLDNASTDRIDKVLKQYSTKVVFIKSLQNLGFGGGHNKIIQSVPLRDRDYYLALNPDAILEKNCVKALVEGCQKHKADWATGKLYKERGKQTVYSVGHAMYRDGYAYNIGYGLQDIGQYDRAREVFGAAGAAAFYKGSMVREVSDLQGLFDPRLFMYYEDVDVDWRARLHKLHCWYIPNATVYHKGGLFPSHLEAQVLVNRFLSVVKNSYWLDLIFYNFPIIFIHMLLRFILTPKVGMQIVLLFFSKAQGALFHKTSPNVSRSVMREWFERAKDDATGVPTSITSRINAFVRRKFI